MEVKTIRSQHRQRRNQSYSHRELITKVITLHLLYSEKVKSYPRMNCGKFRRRNELFVKCILTNGKPAPDIYLLAARCFTDPPPAAKCLVFEDAPAGIAAGNSAGM